MSATPSAPKGLGPAGRALWKRVLADVAAGWELDERDVSCLRGACRAEDRAQELDRLVETEGLMVTGAAGQAKLHPGIPEARAQRQQVALLLARVEMAPPAPRTGHLNVRQRAQLRSAAESHGPP